MSQPIAETASRKTASRQPQAPKQKETRHAHHNPIDHN